MKKIARECQNAGEEVSSDVMRGWPLIGQAGLSELEEQVVLGACHTGDGYEKMKSELMRIFGERREEEEVGWMGGGEDKESNRLGEKKGDVLCAGRKDTGPGIIKKKEERAELFSMLKKIGNTAWECPTKMAEMKCWKCGIKGHIEIVKWERGRKLECKSQEGVEQEWEEGKIEAILDTGCNSSLCGLRMIVF